MAKVKIEFRRSMYGTYKFLDGSPPLSNPDDPKIIELLREVSNSTERTKGRFFTTLGNDTFIAGFISRPQREAVLDLYSTHIDNLDSVDLTDLFDELYTYHQPVDGRAYNFDDRVDIEVNVVRLEGQANSGEKTQRTSDSKQSHHSDSASNAFDTSSNELSGKSEPGADLRDRLQNKSNYSSDSDTEPSPEPGGGAIPPNTSDGMIEDWHEEVAELWQYYRTGDKPLRTSLPELSRFCQRVEGAVAELSYVSTDPARRSRFDVTENGQRERSLEYDNLLEFIRTRAAGGRVDWADLPTYREELLLLLEAEQESLLNEIHWREKLQSQLNEIDSTLADKLIQQQLNDVEALYIEAVSMSMQTDSEDNGVMSRAKGLFSGDSDHDQTIDRIVDQTDNTSLTDTERRQIARYLLRESLDELNEELERQLRKMVLPRLQTLLENRAEEAAIRTIQRVDSVRSTKLFHDVDSDFIQNSR